jgi:hypothetical protein
MRKTITVRLPDDIADWLSETAQKTGMAQERLIREELARAKTADKRSFMRLAGAVDGPLLSKVRAIADTGFLVAFGNRKDHHHAWAVEIAERILTLGDNRKVDFSSGSLEIDSPCCSPVLGRSDLSGSRNRSY